MINLTNIHSYTKYGKSEGILGHDFSNCKSKKQEYIITACIVLRKEVNPVNYMPIEILTKENIEFYRRKQL